MNVFSETAMRIVGDVYKKPVDDAQAAITAATKALADAGSNPTAVAAAQTALNTANTTMTTVRAQQVLAHGVVGGLTAALGGTNPTTGFVGAVAGKTMALVTAELLLKSGIAPGSLLYNQILALSASAAGAVVGGSTGGFIASQGDRFNRQLHPTEISYIQKKASSYAALKGISVDEAERQLAKGALYKNDKDWQVALTLYSATEVAAYKQAAAYLQGQASLDNFTFVNELGKTQLAFTSSNKQFFDETVFLKETLSDAGNRAFYANRANIALRDMNLKQGVSFAANGLVGFGGGVPDGVSDTLKAYKSLLSPQTYAALADAVKVLATNPQQTLETLVNTAKGQTLDIVLRIYLDWLQKDSTELGQRAGYVTGQALVDAAAIAMGVGVAKNGGTLLDKTATLTDAFKTRITNAPTSSKASYAMSAVEANRMARDALPTGATPRATSANLLNDEYLRNNAGHESPYLPGSLAYGYDVAASGEQFVRVYLDPTKQAGEFMVRQSEIAGLNPVQIKDKLALNYVPTTITTVNVPAGTPMRAAVANGILGNKGGAVQFEITLPQGQQLPRSWFVNPRSL